jgi:prepilin peptidase CpaA
VSSILPHALLGTLLFAAAWADVRGRRIRNAMTVSLFLCGAAVSLLDPAAPRFFSSLAASGVVLVPLTLAWRLRLCGGGDAKLAAAAATWVGLSRLPLFAVATAVAGGALSITCYALSAASARRAMRVNLFAASGLGPSAVDSAPSAGRISVPYGAAVAAGALYAVLGAAP